MADKPDDAELQDELEQSRRILQDCPSEAEGLPLTGPVNHADKLSAPGTSEMQQSRVKTTQPYVVNGSAAEFATTGVRSGMQPLSLRGLEAYPRGREAWQPPVTATAAYGSANYDTPPYTSDYNARYDSDCPVLTRETTEHRYPLRSLRTLAQPEASEEASESEERPVRRSQSFVAARTKSFPLEDTERQEIAEWACEVAKRGSIIEREVPAVLRRDCPSVYGDHMASEFERRTENRISPELPTPNKRLSLECRARMEQSSSQRRRTIDSGYYGTACKSNDAHAINRY